MGVDQEMVTIATQTTTTTTTTKTAWLPGRC